MNTWKINVYIMNIIVFRRKNWIFSLSINQNFLKTNFFKYLEYSYYKILFLRKKKTSWPLAALDLAGVEKGEVIPDSAAPKSDFLLFC